MNEIAALVLGTAALAVHLAMSLLAVPFLTGSSAGRPAGRIGWSIAAARAWAIRPFLLASALAAKEPVRSDAASSLSTAAPLVSLALTLAAAALVPSFATGMLDAPLADLPLVLALLLFARLVWLLAAADEGLASAGLAAVGGTVDGVLALPGLVLAVAQMVLWSGGSGLDQMIASQRPVFAPGMLACAASIGLAALAAGGREQALSQTLSGPDLALFRLQNALHHLVWIDLVGALAWPGSLATAQSGPLHWLLGVLFWLLRLGAGALLLWVLRYRLQQVPLRRMLAGMSVMAALLGPVLVLAGQGAS